MAEPTLSVDDHRHGLYAHTPISLLGMLILCGAAFAIFELLQITSTEQSVFDILQIGIQLKPGLTGDQAAQLLNGSLNHNQTIASGIGWSVQIALLWMSMPPEYALAMMHRKYNVVVSASLAKHAELVAKTRTALQWVLIGGDVLTDAYYAVQGHVFLAWDTWHPSITGNVAVLLIGVMYPTGVCFVTFFSGKYMFAYLDALLDKLRGTKVAPPPQKQSSTASAK